MLAHVLRRGVRCLALSLLHLVLLAPAAAQPPAGQQLSREQHLEVIRGQIRELEERLEEAGRAASGLAGRLEHIDVEIDLQQRQVAEAEAARELAAERAEASARRIANLELALERVRADLRRRLAGLYRLGRHGPLRLLLSVEPGSDPLAAARLLRYLVRRDARAIDLYLETRQRLTEEQGRLEAERRGMERWAEAERERRRRLETARRRQAALLAEAERERHRLAERASDLAEKERKLAALIDSLYGGSEAPLAGTPLQEFRGVLDWPAAGEVAVGFGPRRDPRYGTRVPHNGVDLTTTAGTAVRVIFPGQVLFAAPFEGYGPTVVVHHPGRAFSLYAGLRQLKVSEGDVLSLGDVLGTASDELYFEIRVENRPEDPLRWLR